jgi:hypothetical protein
LELGLRERFDSEIPPNPNPRKATKYRTRYGQVTLGNLMHYIDDQQKITNGDFAIGWHRAKIRAMDRRKLALVAELNDTNPTSEYDEDDYTILPEDSTWDFGGDLKKNLPDGRNTHARGSTML